MNRRLFRPLQMGLGLVLAVIVLAGAYSNNVNAEAANTLKVTPVRSDIEIKPGASQTVKVTVTNLTDKPIVVRPIENDFVAGDENGTPALILNEDQYAPTHSLKRFLTPLADVRIPAKNSKTIEVGVTVPSTAQAGGYFGAIRFAPASADTGGQVNLSASVASLILLTVPGDLVQQLSLTSFDIQQGGKSGTDFRTPNDLQLAVRLENKGNIQAGPFGKISVKQGDKVVYETDFNNANPKDMVLPDSARKWTVPLKNIGDFGHYTVSATFTYGTKNQTIDVSKSFWVIPQWMIITAIIAAVVLLVAIVLVVWLIVRRNSSSGRRRKMRPSGHRLR